MNAHLPSIIIRTCTIYRFKAGTPISDYLGISYFPHFPCNAMSEIKYVYLRKGIE
jgi:hypothetical protein